MDHFKTLLKELNLTFDNQSLLLQAFTHRSYLNESTVSDSNERLEFLGDAILSFIVSEYLFQKFPQHPEGLLTNLRSSIVKTETLASVAASLKFGAYLFLSKGEEKGGGRNNISLLADVFEAFVCALFLDQGLTKVKAFLDTHLFPKLDTILSDHLFSDYKSKLQEVVQITSLTPPTYKVIKTEGPDHAKTFWVRVLIDGNDGEIGVGKSKQEAEQAAAAATLEKRGKI